MLICWIINSILKYLSGIVCKNSYGSSNVRTSAPFLEWHMRCTDFFSSQFQRIHATVGFNVCPERKTNDWMRLAHNGQLCAQLQCKSFWCIVRRQRQPHNRRLDWCYCIRANRDIGQSHHLQYRFGIDLFSLWRPYYAWKFRTTSQIYNVFARVRNGNASISASSNLNHSLLQIHSTTTTTPI